jgi:glycosyltransferase involved in cell wall biosynthesis
MLRRSRSGSDAPIRRSAVYSWLRQNGIDFVVYPSPTPLSFEIGLPYAIAVHDLQHRVHPEFPEVTADGEFEAREYLYRHGISGATLVIVDSVVGKEDVLEYYGELIDADRVCVLPFLPSESCRRSASAFDQQRVASVYGLPERFLFYPAQLWPHKNHAMLVRALGLLRKSEDLEIPLVLVGSAQGKIRSQTWREVLDLAQELGLEGSIRHLGYVPHEDMAPLYASATALTMPTWFGPTNIPVLEAWAQNCPVLTSDIRGVREQAGDAAVLADPASAEGLAEGVRRLWLDADLRAELIEHGKRRLDSYTRHDYAAALSRILDQATSCVVAQAQ